MWWSLRGDKWQYNMAHTSCMLDKQGYTRAYTCREVCSTYCFSVATGIANAPHCYVIRTLPVLFKIQKGTYVDHCVVALHISFDIPPCSLLRGTAVSGVAFLIVGMVLQGA